MKKIMALLIALSAIVVACNNEAKKAQANNATDTTCYQSVNDKDSILLQLTINGSSVSGTLSYHLMEKDKNTGTIEGELIGDTIFADYHFLSEGTQSVREVAFIKKGNDLVEGFGPVDDKNGKMVFRDRSALVFNDANRLVKSDCVQ